jgi:hypothetical protein
MGSHLLTAVVRRRDWRRCIPGSPPNHINRGYASELEWRIGQGQTGRSLNARATSFGQVLDMVLDHRHPADREAGGPAVKAPGRSLGRCLGQAVTGGLRFWRRRRWRGVLSAVVVDPGLRPRFFSVLPTPANFRSR